MSEKIAESAENDRKDFPTLHVASAACGIALCEGMSFSRMSEISEWALGHPVWTHELGDKVTMGRVCRAILTQFPAMPHPQEAREDWKAVGARVVAAYGDTVTLARGDGQRTEGPISSLSRMLEQRA